MIKIVSYGSGNVKAIYNIYKKLGIQCCLASQKEDLATASKIILPGVGAFDETILQLESSGMKDALDHLVLDKKIPTLGICVGMQVMACKSEEGVKKGLNWIDGVVKILDITTLKHKTQLPHMGWNTVIPKKSNQIFNNLNTKRGFYFLHSYYFSCSRREDILASTFYGDEFTSAIQSENIYGFQFHPEKSHENGINLLKNFAGL